MRSTHFCPGVDRHVSTGPLAEVHASFEPQCTACHGLGTGRSIAADAWRLADEASLTQLEFACQTCHAVEHHFRDRLISADVDRNCSGCHRDHQGRNHPLASVSTHTCVLCHADLEVVTQTDRAPRVRSEIQSFTDDSHGDFRSLEQDRGRIRFDHAQHLRPGQVEKDQRGGMRWDSLETSWQARYRQEGPSKQDLVQLDCGDCHQRHPFGGDAVVTSGDAELGRYFLPVRFEEHCAACHALNYLGRTDELLPLPHAAPWGELQALLTAKREAGRLTGRLRMPFEFDRVEPIPGWEPRPTAAQVTTDVDELEHAIAEVRQRCGQCHAEQDVNDDSVRQDPRKPGDSLMPHRWLQYGLFDHAAHDRMECRYCHDTSSPDPNGAATDQQHVMIRGIDSCIGCHRPPTEPPPEDFATPEIQALIGSQPIWASDRCATCHRYHWTRPEPLADRADMMSVLTVENRPLQSHAAGSGSPDHGCSPP